MINLNSRTAATYLAAVFAGSLFLTSASASPITGTLQIGNGVVAVTGSGTSPGSCVDFYNTVQACGTPGNFNVTAGSTGIFTSVVNSTDNTIKDLQSTFPISQFITVPDTVGGPVFFDLPSLNLNPTTVGNCASTAVNDNCSPQGSPFTLVNSSTVDPITGQANAVTVKLDVNLIGYQNSTVGGTSPYHGTFTTQLTTVPLTACGPTATVCDANIASVLFAVSHNMTLSGNSYSATVSPTAATTPEPGSLIMLLSGAGLLALGFINKRRQSSRA